MNRSGLAALLLAAVLSACASAGASGAAVSRSLIALEEIQRSQASTVYELVQQRRPHWLRIRGRSSIHRAGGIVVYTDGIRFGGVESLSSLNVTQVKSVRYLDGAEATTRFGTDHDAGAILVATR